MMKKILFLIHDLGHGGAEKVLVNLVNNLDRSKFDISVTVLFGGGVNEQFLKPDIHFKAVFPKMIPGNSHWMKLMTPQQLHRLCVKKHYDIEVSYLEGPSARVISGCQDEDTKLICWIHSTTHSLQQLSLSFRHPKEALRCYRKYHKIIAVSEGVKNSFLTYSQYSSSVDVFYNVNETEKIIALAQEKIERKHAKEVYWCGMGKVTENKGFDRMLHIQKRLVQEGYPVILWILGTGPLEQQFQQWCEEQGLSDTVKFWGYQTNPYAYLANSDLFVCASHAEGFSTAATEALIVGTPVCTVEVSGMKEMLGEHNEYGIVTENNEEALYQGIKRLLDDPALLAHYKKQAEIRGKAFSTEETVHAVEQMMLTL